MAAAASPAACRALLVVQAECPRSLWSASVADFARANPHGRLCVLFKARPAALLQPIPLCMPSCFFFFFAPSIFCIILTHRAQMLFPAQDAAPLVDRATLGAVTASFQAISHAVRLLALPARRLCQTAVARPLSSLISGLSPPNARRPAWIWSLFSRQLAGVCSPLVCRRTSLRLRWTAGSAATAARPTPVSLTAPASRRVFPS